MKTGFSVLRAGLATVSVGGSASAGVSFISTSWHAQGSGRLVEPGFADMAGSYDRTGNATTSETLLTLRNQPDFSTTHPWVDQVMTTRFEDRLIPFDPQGFRIFSRSIHHVHGPGSATDLESVLTAHAVIEITGGATELGYQVSARGGGAVDPLLVGMNHRSSRVRIAPVGGATLVDISTASDYTASTSDGDGITLQPGFYEFDLEIAIRIHQVDVLGNARSDVAAEISWAGIPAPGGVGLAMAAGMFVARRRR